MASPSNTETAASGIVRNAVTGAPIPSANLYELDATGRLLQAGRTGADGGYALFCLKPEHRYLAGRATGFAPDLLGLVPQAQCASADLFLLPFTGGLAGSVSAGSDSLPRGAAVRIFDAPGIPIADAAPDGGGAFRLPDLAPGDYRLVVSAPGCLTAWIGAAVAVGGESILTLRLSPGGGRIEGAVLTENGEPVPDAVIEVYSQDDLPLAATRSTEPGGAYAVAGLAPGSHKVVAAAPGRASAWTGAVVTEESVAGADLVLRSGAGAVSGSVKGPRGVPCPAALTIYTAAGLAIATRLTGADGGFLLPGLRPGDYLLQARAPGYAVAVAGFSVAGGRTAEIEMVLEAPAAELAGFVHSAGRPVAGAVLRLFDRGGRPWGFGLSGPDGRYRLCDLPAGSAILVASAPGLAAAVQELILRTGGCEKLDLELPSGPVGILKRIVDGQGEPVAGAQVGVSDPEGRRLFTVLTNGEGLVWLRGMARDRGVRWG